MATLVSTVTQSVNHTVTKTLSSATASSTLRAPSQGGILEGGDPSVYDPKNPIIIFIIQAGIIIIFCRLLHWPLSKLRQPRVIAEVIGGILLGPSVMGRIPHFTTTIFPSAAMPNLSLIANIGLVLFLFLVGLEVDLRFLASNWRIAVSVGLAGMALPFGLGCGIAWGLYNEFRNEPGTKTISFGVYMLFIGVAMAITAFPVLCRILTELKLLRTPVGIIVLSAGVGNDVVGWILLALCVALVNAGTGLTALWVLLTCVGYVLFLVYAIRPAFLWILRKTRALQDGPSQSIVALTLMIALTSAFFTGVIGVHPIFGAFMAGLICPHEGGFAIKVTEKVEDLVSALFLPLYFALSGLSTNLGLLDSGMVWAYVIGVISVAFCGKFVGAALSAKLSGMVWRESFAIGSLMSCKGLVELIVLNIGLQAKILSTRTFTIFVVMALITTFATTPLTSYLYPPWYQRKIEAWKRGEIDWDTGKPSTAVSDTGSARDSLAYEKLEASKVHKMLVYLRLDNMPTILAFMALLGGTPQQPAAKLHPSRVQPAIKEETEEAGASTDKPKRPVEAHGVRMLELTERSSSVMQVAELDEYSAHDPLVNTFRTFGRLHNLAVSGEVTVLPEGGFADALATKASMQVSDLLLLPWTETGSISESQPVSSESSSKKLAASAYTAFVTSLLKASHCNTAVFINRNFGGTSVVRERLGLRRSKSVTSLASGKDNDYMTPQAPIQDRSHHIFCPFFGGPDDRCALRLVLQMAENADVTATIVHFVVADSYFDSVEEIETVDTPIRPTPSRTPTSASKGGLTTPTVAKTSDAPEERDSVFFSSLKSSLPAEMAARVLFETMSVPMSPVKAVVDRASQEVGQSPRNSGDLIVLGRSAARAAAFARESGTKVDDNARCLGFLGAEVAQMGVRGSTVVVQSGEVSNLRQ